MTLDVKADVQGLEQVLDRILGLSDRSRDLGPLWDRIYAGFLKREQERFASDGGGWWAPDLPATRARKLDQGQDPRTLRATGSLYRSLTSAGAPGAMFEPRGDSVRMGTSVENAKYQQGGEGREDRRVVVITPRLRRDIADAVADWIVDGKA